MIPKLFPQQNNEVVQAPPPKQPRKNPWPYGQDAYNMYRDSGSLHLINNDLRPYDTTEEEKVYNAHILDKAAKVKEEAAKMQARRIARGTPFPDKSRKRYACG